MKYRGFISSVLMMATLLCGCTAAPSAAKEIAQYYQSLTAWQANVSMTVDLGTQTAAFLLAWDVTPNDSRITVLEPSEIAGIGVMIAPDRQTLSYETASIALPRSDGTMAPMPLEALCAIEALWKYGVRTAEAMESRDGIQVIRIDCSSSDETQPLSITSWFDAAARSPVAAEVYYEGERLIACEFHAFVPQLCE